MTIPAITSLTSSQTWHTKMPPLARTDSDSFFRTVRSVISSTSIESQLGPPFVAFEGIRGALPARSFSRFLNEERQEKKPESLIPKDHNPQMAETFLRVLRRR
jgi:hypothetical protein